MTPRTRRARLVPVLAAVSLLALGACSSSAEIEEQARADEGGERTALTVDTGPEQDRIHTGPSEEAIALLPEGAAGFTTIELKSNFLGTVREGRIATVATNAHAGRTTQVWDAVDRDPGSGKTIALFRCTQSVLWPR